MKNTEEMKNLRSMDAEHLQKELLDTKKKLLNDHLKVQADKLDNYSLIAKNRRKVARISTIINEKIINEAYK